MSASELHTFGDSALPRPAPGRSVARAGGAGLAARGAAAGGVDRAGGRRHRAARLGAQRAGPAGLRAPRRRGRTSPRCADALGLARPGVGMLTAAEVAAVAAAEDAGVRVEATVGLTRPTWAAAPDEACDVGGGDDQRRGLRPRPPHRCRAGQPAVHGHRGQGPGAVRRRRRRDRHRVGRRDRALPGDGAGRALRGSALAVRGPGRPRRVRRPPLRGWPHGDHPGAGGHTLGEVGGGRGAGGPPRRAGDLRGHHGPVRRPRPRGAGGGAPPAPRPGLGHRRGRRRPGRACWRRCRGRSSWTRSARGWPPRARRRRRGAVRRAARPSRRHGGRLRRGRAGGAPVDRAGAPVPGRARGGEPGRVRRGRPCLSGRGRRVRSHSRRSGPPREAGAVLPDRAGPGRRAQRAHALVVPARRDRRRRARRARRGGWPAVSGRPRWRR